MAQTRPTVLSITPPMMKETGTCNGGYRRERAGGFQVGVDERPSLILRGLRRRLGSLGIFGSRLRSSQLLGLGRFFGFRIAVIGHKGHSF